MVSLYGISEGGKRWEPVDETVYKFGDVASDFQVSVQRRRLIAGREAVYCRNQVTATPNEILWVRKPNVNAPKNISSRRHPSVFHLDVSNVTIWFEPDSRIEPFNSNLHSNSLKAEYAPWTDDPSRCALPAGRRSIYINYHTLRLQEFAADCALAEKDYMAI